MFTAALVSTEDLLPTVCDLTGLALPPYPLSGTSLRPLLDRSASAVRDRVVSAESSRQASLALRTTRWKLIAPIVTDAAGQLLPDPYGRPRCPAPLLFDLEQDPREERDVSRAEPAVLAALSHDLAQWRADMAAATGEPDPIRSQGLSLPYQVFMDRLRARPH